MYSLCTRKETVHIQQVNSRKLCLFTVYAEVNCALLSNMQYEVNLRKDIHYAYSPKTERNCSFVEGNGACLLCTQSKSVRICQICEVTLHFNISVDLSPKSNITLVGLIRGLDVFLWKNLKSTFNPYINYR